VSHIRLLAVGRLAAVLLTLAALPAAAAVFKPRTSSVDPGGAQLRPAAPEEVDAPDSLEYRLVARDPFRPSHRPASVAFDPNPAPPTPPPPKPSLLVTGILWGREPSAVLEGLPGVDGARLMRVGEHVAGFRIRRITPKQVTVTGMDTTWVLDVRKVW
jgi:hypothetical protein